MQHPNTILYTVFLLIGFVFYYRNNRQKLKPEIETAINKIDTNLATITSNVNETCASTTKQKCILSDKLSDRVVSKSIQNNRKRKHKSETAEFKKQSKRYALEEQFVGLSMPSFVGVTLTDNANFASKSFCSEQV
jgi:hypothetical protein